MTMQTARVRNSLVLLAVLMLATAQVSWVSRRFMVIAPGASMRLDEVVEVQGGKRDSKGLFLITAVYAEVASPISLIFALFDGNTDIQANDGNNIDGSPDSLRKLDMDMRKSQQIASVVALRQMGYSVPEVRGVLVEEVFAGSAFAGKLAAGDLVRSVDGKRVSSPEELTELIKTREEGDMVSVKVTRDGRPLSFTGRLARDSRSRLGLGAKLASNVEYHLPIDVNYDTGDIGGSSGGLMFALEVADQLDGRDLTKGLVIAGTGTLSGDGSVKPVAGVKQKVISARRWGADVFLVPEANASEAIRYAGEMRVVTVSTFAGCLRALEGEV